MKYDLPDELTVEADGPVRTVVINRADELNCVNENLHWALANVWRQLAADKDAKVAVLTGAGRAFCAGGDLNWITSFLDDPVARDEKHPRGRADPRRDAALPAAGHRRGQWARGRVGLQHRVVVRHRADLRGRVPGQPARCGGSGGRRRRCCAVAAAVADHEVARIPLHRRPHRGLDRGGAGPGQPRGGTRRSRQPKRAHWPTVSPVNRRPRCRAPNASSTCTCRRFSAARCRPASPPRSSPCSPTNIDAGSWTFSRGPGENDWQARRT